MIKIEKPEVFGFESAIRGMRNPMNSWDLSDSEFATDIWNNELDTVESEPCVSIGEKDLDLMKRLVSAGTDHSKFMRMITVYFDITAPMYFYKEFDTYKVGTVRNSCSTMHKITSKEFTSDDFSTEHLVYSSADILDGLIESLNYWREKYIKQNNPETRDDKSFPAKDCWWQLIQLLPSSYNQKSTICTNYAVLRNMYHARKNHKLDEWHTFCSWIETLPYSELIVGDKNA